MCERVIRRNIVFCLLLGVFLQLSIGDREIIFQRFRRQSSKAGRCPPWTMIRNCSSKEQCNWDGDCFGGQKCCVSTCETRSCHEPVAMIGPHEDVCPRDEALQMSNRGNCHPVRTRFCFKTNCKRCCFHYSTCNPNPDKLMSKDDCREVLCSSTLCEFPGEICILDKFNSPRCACRSRCPAPRPGEDVCGTDGIPYKSACELNRTACILGARDIKIHSYGNCRLNGAKVKISAAHKRMQILPVRKQGKLTCQFEGDPVSITWEKVGLRTLPDRMVPRLNNLDILNVDMTDSGLYKCMAYDGFSKAQAEINVTVSGPDSKPEVNLPFKDCSKHPISGYCDRFVVRWYFDWKNGVCRTFAYGGCGGNKNNFPTQQSCNSACGHAAADACNLPVKIGPCKGLMLRWFYNSNTSRCEQFVYGGCNGNANRFNTKAHCQRRCKAKLSLNSPCLRQRLETRRSGSHVFIPTCQPDGRYDAVQCNESVCFCVDDNGKEIVGTRVSRQHHLNCTKSTTNPTDSLTQCQMARQNSSRYPFGSSHLIRCKQDGSYQQIQCSGTTGYCWCVDENGFKLTGTETRGSLRCPVLGGRSTLCQRQYLESLRNPQPNQYTPRCQQDGKFERVQCQENRCFCVDTESGRVLRDTSVSMLFGEPRCDNKGHGLTLCQLLHEEAVANPSDEIYIPQCKRNGSFENVQCHGLSKECWCVNREGRELTGTRTNGTISCSGLGKAVTKCQREYQNILRNFPPSITRYVPRCSADGTYEQIQCSGAVCYCVTPQGQQISGTKTFSYTRRPNCTQSDANDRACEKRRQEAFLSSKRFIPFCKPDGSWSEIQCEHFSKLCWCVDSTGKEVPGTKSRNLKTCPDLGCHQFSGTMSPCRKRVLNLLKSGNPRRHVPWCKVDGSYNPLQCYGSYCYCVYENGYEQPGTKISVALGRPLCTRTGGRVSECQRKNQEALAKPNQNEFLPRCKSDGRYEEVQCQSSSGECWCVDQEGKEIPRTRTAKILKCPVIVDQLTSCQRMYLKYAKNPHTSKMIPRCRRDGTFEPMQCKGLDCFCVDSKGMEINGTSLPVRLGKPKCGTRGDDVLTLCQKQQMKAIKNTTRLSRFIPTCKRDGRFEEIQCLRSSGECWCVDEQGKEINGSRTANHLRCPSRASPLTQCEMEQQEILRSWIVPGPYIPQCADDGRYNPIQCQGQYCYCVNGYGVELVESRVHITEGRPHCYDGGALITLCQSQFRDFLRQPITGRFEPRCSSTGAFQEVQCHGKECFCVNREGSEIPNTRQIISMGKLVCPQQGNSLTKCQKQLQEAIHLPPDPKRLVPQCKFNGNYEEIQCNKSSGLCWCVEKDMKEIPSTVTNQTVHCPPLETNSLCWTRYQQNIRKGIHIPWCMPDGSFSPLQIQGSRFFCVNVKGGEVPGTSVDVSQGKPDCHAANSRGYIATPCQREQARRSYLPLQAGKPVPSCKVDGSYDEVQCDVIIGQCWCVNGEGREIHGTRSEGIIRCPDKVSLTPCQKRQERAQKLSVSGPDSWIFVPRCQDDGSYYKVQCFPSTGQCWCADINGNERWGTLMQGQPDCSVNVTTCQRHRIRALGLTGSPPLGTYVPRCNPDGSYSDVQCHAFTGICWCVNEKGHEIPGTKNWGWSQCLRRDGDTPLDLGIVIDVSESSAANWTRTLNFVHSVVGSFNISASGTHLGLIAFSSKAEIELYFNTFLGANLTVEKVKTVVSTLLPREGPIRFEEALLLAEEELFRQENGMREGVSKTLLLVTRSSLKRSQGPHTPLSASARALKDRGISMYTIGIGHNVELSELMDLASDYRNVFTADDLSVLQSSGKILTEIIKNNTNYGVTKEGLCNMPPEPGQLGCLASNLAYYYEAVSGECQSFIYSGCGGNANNFNSYEKCMNYCKGILPSCIDEGNRVASLQLHHYSPTCKTNGRYEDVQCFRKTGYCWCVDEFGKEIMGTRIMGIPICSLATTFGKLTPCLEERQKALGMNGVSSVGRFAPECNPNGEYAQIQCFGNTNFCWCSDKQGYEIAGTHRWGTPDCPVEVRPGECPFIQNPAECHTLMSNQTCLKDSDCSESYKCCDCGCVRRCTLVPQYEPAPVSNCLREHVKSLSSSCPHFKAVGRFFPSCKSNGDYEEWQCNEHYGVCWCVDRDGNEIPGTRQKGKPDCEKLVAMKPCQRERMRAMAMRTRTVVGMFIPSCQPDGSYNLIQCHNVTGFCWCVDNLGNIMTGTRQWGKPNCTRISQTDKRPTVCQSRRDECLENAPRGHFIPRCKADGSFEERQCLHLTRECWCVDRSGNELPGTRSLNTRDCSLLAWLSPCQIQRRQALGPRGVPVVGLVAPECKADGGYENLQCDMTSGYCWCLDEYGNEVPESRVKRRPSCAKEPPCKKEMEEILSSFQNPPPGMFVPQCRDDGGYQSTQCHGSSGYCWCVDEYGNELIDTRVRGQRNCSALKHRSMSLCYSDYNKATEVNEHGHHVPQCGFDGSYKQMQCNRQSGECWCVDKNGKEKPETRTTEMPHCQLKEEKVNCKLPPDAGPCTANMPSWFFNKTAEACEVFIYGGCGGNSNRFPSYYDCQDNCKGHNLTFCELQRAINSVRSEEFIPDCKANGEFEEVQCNRITGECWCVDTAGIEILDSRTIGSPYCHELEEIGSRKANSS